MYVVDLVKFRETAAGDQLRVVYETLSKDPNSLSNLDQASTIHVFVYTTVRILSSWEYYVKTIHTTANIFIYADKKYFFGSQDLPNYAQHSVQIFSLPQEWLWCESWCGNATKSKAKTIDLCNNPMTKEPKLQVKF